MKKFLQTICNRKKQRKKRRLFVENSDALYVRRKAAANKLFAAALRQDYKKDFCTNLNTRINVASSDIASDGKCLYRRNTKRARCNLAFTIGGKAAPLIFWGKR